MADYFPSSGVIRRLKKEEEKLKNDPPIGCHAEPTSEDYVNWQATILGPEGTPYENGLFYLKIEIPKEYPFKPPKAWFTTKIYHVNVDKDGWVSLDILVGDLWSPAMMLSRVISTIRSLLIKPDGDYCVSGEMDRMFRNNRTEYDDTAREWTRKHAID